MQEHANVVSAVAALRRDVSPFIPDWVRKVDNAKPQEQVMVLNALSKNVRKNSVPSRDVPSPTPLLASSKRVEEFAPLVMLLLLDVGWLHPQRLRFAFSFSNSCIKAPTSW